MKRTSVSAGIIVGQASYACGRFFMLVLCIAVACFYFSELANAATSDPQNESLRRMISVPDTIDVNISPDGEKIAFVREQADWSINWYDLEIFLSEKGEVRQLTNVSDGASWSPKWRPGRDELGYICYSKIKGAQVCLLQGKETTPHILTLIEGGIKDFEWAPDGGSMAILLKERADDVRLAREEKYGRFHVKDVDSEIRHLWLLNVVDVLQSGHPASRPGGGTTEQDFDAPKLKRLTGGRSFTVGGFFNNGGFAFAPDGSEIFFDHSKNNFPSANSVNSQDISALNIATGKIRSVVKRPGIDSNPRVSPDGATISFDTSNGEYSYFGRDHIGFVSSKGGRIRVPTIAFHESARAVGWDGRDFYFIASDKMRERLYRIDSRSLKISEIYTDNLNVTAADVSIIHENIVFLADSDTRAVELYRKTDEAHIERLTNVTDEFFKNIPLPRSRIITYTSKDGVTNEGVLLLPASTQVKEHSVQPRPLMIIVHGGPKNTSRPQRVYDYVYPIYHWLDEGAVVFLPNYRGSAGFGDIYRENNYRDLGHGVMSDVMAGVDKLIKEGVANPDRLGMMGWSQGGYITAFISTHSDRIKAASVGAGISDWRTYYISSDNPEFTVQYLGATPADDNTIYDQTSAIVSIKYSRTPTLIQHGRNDARVPLSNGLELYHYLKDRGAETQLVIYEGLGHWLSHPKERLAAVEHNILWFNKYVFGGAEGTDMTLELKDQGDQSDTP